MVLWKNSFIIQSGSTISRGRQKETKASTTKGILKGGSLCRVNDDTCLRHQRKKTVTFAGYGQVKLTRSLTEYSEEEMSLCWYNSAEYQTIRTSCRKQIVKIENGEVLKDRKYSSRGLENQTRIRSIAKLKKRRESINAVLVKQSELVLSSTTSSSELVTTLGTNEAQQRQQVEMIAQAYRCYTSSCQIWANVVGLSDARNAAAFHEEDEDIDDAVGTSELLRVLQYSAPTVKKDSFAAASSFVITKVGPPRCPRPLLAMPRSA